MINNLIKTLIRVGIKPIASNPKIFEFFRKNVESHYLKHNLRKLDVAISTVYDIGANKGEWSKELSKTLPEAKFYLFEANEKNKKKLKDSGFEYFINCLSHSEGTAEFFEVGGTGDSIYKEESEVYSSVKPKIIRTTTLDKLQESKNLKKPDFIKIDTQGSEIDILKGASSIIKTCKLIQLEISITQTNLNAPTIGEYLDFMKEIDFIPLDIIEKHNRFKTELSQVDILFLRKEYT